MRMIKYAGLAIIAIGLIVIITDQNPGSEAVLLAGLFIFFLTKEAKEDERSVSIKASSVYTSLVLSYIIAALSSNFAAHGIINFQLSSINHFLILVFSMATIIYYTRMLILK